MQYDENIRVLDIPKTRSSSIKKLEYDENNRILTVHLHWTDTTFSYEKVDWQDFEDMMNAESIGKYYNAYIKKNFKQLKQTFMSDQKKRPPTKNQASNEKRFIKISLDVRKIRKDWIIGGKTGDYLAITLAMLPDGTLDKYGNLGMVTQDVPQDIYEAEKSVPKAMKTMGPILGNGAEMDWQKNEGLPGQTSGQTISKEAEGDLPF